MAGDKLADLGSAASSPEWVEHRLRLVDVGGAGGLQPKWLTCADRIIPILFEPNPDEAAKLRGTLEGKFDSGLVVETGLSNVVGTQDLNIARYWGCSSLRRPNRDVLSKYRIAPLFDVTGTAAVACTRYDALYHAGKVPAPDAIKIDVQGFEYEVLQGFGGLLQTCLGIELEAHIYPIYQNQKLLHHLVAFLADFGFVLRRLVPVPSFDGDVVEFDVWFTKDIEAWRRFDPVQKKKFGLLCKVWNLVDYRCVDPSAPHTQLELPDAVSSSHIQAKALDSLPSYAVVFKTHFWDEFADRQFRRLCDRAGSGQVFVVVDETHGPVAGIRHDDVLRMTEQMSEADGYLCYPSGNLFWYNTDYQVYHFFDEHPEYDYVFICEYDCTINIEVSTIIRTMAAQKLGFVGERVRAPEHNWPWAQYARPYYPDDIEFSGRLVCCAAFSRDFARKLQAARRDHTRRALAQEIVVPEASAIVWPNNEAFIGAEIARLSVAEASLSAFGDTSHYDWAPPHLEIELPNLAAFAVVHPVLDAPRYIQSVLKLGWRPEDLLREGSHLQSRLDQCDAAFVVPMFLQYFAQAGDWAAVDHLRDYATERIGGQARVLFNVARGKPTTQSSTCRWSRSPYLARDSAGAVNGQITGGFGFHTDLEEAPWWCVDLEAIYPVREVCIYNRMDQPSRSRSLILSFSPDMTHWDMLYRHEGGDFGGADGTPLRIELINPIQLRFLRVSLFEKQILHLDEVEIYV